MSYDEDCYTLAAKFLSDDPALIRRPGHRHALADELAQLIQTTIEDFLEFGTGQYDDEHDALVIADRSRP